MGLANSFALKMARISNNTHDPVGGTIVKSLEGGKFEASNSLHI